MPNTPNSHVTYSIVSGNEDKKFSIEGSGKAVVVLRKKLDFEAGDRVFNLTVLAQVSLFRGVLFSVSQCEVVSSFYVI
jgi:hypothetical protein